MAATFQPPTAHRILVVEDDRTQAALLRHWLETADHSVEVATTVSEARARLADGTWDCVLSDLRLPDGSGLDVLKEMRLMSPDTKTALMTNAGDMQTAIDAMRSGLDDFLVKPLTFDGVMARLDAMSAPTEPPERVLAIGAHPDDVEIGCGGTLLAHAKAGANIMVLTMSGGSHGGVADERRGEALAAAACLGAELRFGGLRDTTMVADGSTICVIEDAVRAFQPTIVYTHTKHDTHQDHRAIHEATLVAARGVGRVYCYQAPSTTIDFRPTRFVGIDDQLGGKLSLLAAYASQNHRAYLSEDFVRATATYWGRYAGYAAVEPFEIVRDAAGSTTRTQKRVDRA